jgi:S-adenosylmethionine:tRNA ribosyltransferase-isomerase
LPDLLAPGDLLVVNDAATLPASLPGRVARERVELRLAAHLGGTRWRAVLLGRGDWRTRTEHRPPPPAVSPGARIEIAGELAALVTGVSAVSERLIDVAFDASETAVWRELYANGRPVQYAHLRDALDLWSVQTAYGARPWSVEMPSAGRPLAWSLLMDLRRRGVPIATLTHGAGLSSTGDPAIDALLPLPERYDLPAETVAAIATARAGGGRVIAVGTTVVRALEGAAQTGLEPGVGITDLVIGAGHRLQVVDGLVSGMHDPTESHFRLLSAFAPRPLLLGAWHHAVGAGYLGHEFGDVSLIAPGVAPAISARSETRIAS